MSKKKKIVIVLILVAIVAAIFVARNILHRPQKNADMLKLSGNIELTQVEISFKIPGRVEKRLVSEGERVTKGQIVAQLDRQELVQEVSLRKADMAATQSTLSKMEAGYRLEEIAQAEAVVQRLKADTDRLAEDNNRQKQLYEKEVISTREYDVSKSNYEMAAARLREGKEKLGLLKKGYRKEDIEEARAHLKKAKEALSQSETRLGYATLASPLSGIVLSENVETGEYIVPGTPVVTVGDLEKTWLRAYINETDLGRVRVGQKVRISTDTYPGKTYEGTVTFLASNAEFTPKNIQTEKERTKLVYRIKIDVPNLKMELKPGMPADAEIMIAETSNR